MMGSPARVLVLGGRTRSLPRRPREKLPHTAPDLPRLGAAHVPEPLAPDEPVAQRLAALLAHAVPDVDAQPVRHPGLRALVLPGGVHGLVLGGRLALERLEVALAGAEAVRPRALAQRDLDEVLGPQDDNREPRLARLLRLGRRGLVAKGAGAGPATGSGSGATSRLTARRR